MKTLYSALEKKAYINKINAKSFEQAILEAYTDSKYRFFHNSELLDVEDRFRIFKYNNINYIVKKIKKKKSIAEYTNTIKAAKLLNNKRVNNYYIEVIEPKEYNIDGKYYIATEYKGNTLHECLYTKKVTDFTIDDLRKMLEIFSDLGIEYHGLSPRNMVLSKEKRKIYLFDFENAIFSGKIKYYNMIYITNILVNWSYLYNYNDLKSIINELKIENGIEPELNSYELNYKQMIGFFGTNLELRQNIMNVVLKAEKKVNMNNYKYCLLPIDMASIISDLFDFSIDAIMDMTFYSIRKCSEKKYKKILYEFNEKIIYAYKNEFNLQKAILPVLIYAIGNIDFKQSINSECKLLNYYYDNNFDKFKEELKNKLYIIYRIVYPDFKISNLNIDELSEYLLLFKNSK